MADVKWPDKPVHKNKRNAFVLSRVFSGAITLRSANLSESTKRFVALFVLAFNDDTVGKCTLEQSLKVLGKIYRANYNKTVTDNYINRYLSAWEQEFDIDRETLVSDNLTFAKMMIPQYNIDNVIEDVKKQAQAINKGIEDKIQESCNEINIAKEKKSKELSLLLDDIRRQRVGIAQQYKYIDGKLKELKEHDEKENNIIVSHKILLLPNNKQKTFLSLCLKAYCDIYAWGAAQIARQRKESGKASLSDIRDLYQKSKDDLFPNYSQLPSRVSQTAFYNLDTAFSRFIRGMAAPPSVDGKRNGCVVFYPQHDPDNDTFLSDRVMHIPFHYPNAENKGSKQYVRVPNLGWVRMSEYLRFHGIVKCYVLTSVAGRFYMTFFVRISKGEYALTHRQHSPSKASVGIDLGLSSPMTLSNGIKVEKCDMVSEQQKLRKLNRALRLKQWKGNKDNNWKHEDIPISHNAEKAFLKRDRLVVSMTDKRKDYIEKLTNIVVANFQNIGIETLNSMSMRRKGGHLFNRHLAEVPFYKIRQRLEEKCSVLGNKLVKAERYYPSTRICSSCGAIMQPLPLEQRIFHCVKCGLTIDRDMNAAVNLKKLIGQGLSELTSVDLKQLMLDFERNRISVIKDDAESKQP